MELFSKDKIEFFNKEGYIILPSVYSQDEVIFLRHFFDQLFDSEFYKLSPFDSPTIINDLYAHFPELIHKIFKPQYIQAAKELLGEHMVCVPECSVHHDRYFDWHRDTAIMEAQQILTHKVNGNKLIQGGIYLQDNLASGGGLLLIPGSNKGKDRFLKHYYGYQLDKILNRLQKILQISVGHRIEYFEHPILPPTKAGDVLFFDSQLDHRASFKRNIIGNAVNPGINKYAIFNSFCSNAQMANDYFDSTKNPDEPYANFLKQTKIPPALREISKELNFEIVYSR